MWRIPEQDQLKIERFIKEQREMLCRACGHQGLTIYQGPGQDGLCRDCQLKDAEYEWGLGYHGRWHTYHRSWECEMCQYDPRQDVRLLKKDWTPQKQKALWSSQLIGDHIIPRKSGGVDTPENIQTLCWVCNAVKSMENNDWSSQDVLSRMDPLFRPQHHPSGNKNGR